MSTLHEWDSLSAALVFMFGKLRHGPCTYRSQYRLDRGRVPIQDALNMPTMSLQRLVYSISLSRHRGGRYIVSREPLYERPINLSTFGKYNSVPAHTGKAWLEQREQFQRCLTSTARARSGTAPSQLNFAEQGCVVDLTVPYRRVVDVQGECTWAQPEASWVQVPTIRPHILSANHAQPRCQRALCSMLTTSRPMTPCRTSNFARVDGAMTLTDQAPGRNHLLVTQQDIA